MTDTTKAKPVPTPAPAPAARPSPPRSYGVIVRGFSGYEAGQVVDVTDWAHFLPLAETRYVRAADKDTVSDAVPCTVCRKKWLDDYTFDSHDCLTDPDTETEG